MAYVREKANQILIVHGERDRATGKVRQSTLFTLYSKAEALEAIGRTAAKRDWQFQMLLEQQYPDIRFNWEKINLQIREKMGSLPDLWEYGDTRLRKGFRKSLAGFVRHLLLADPHVLSSSRALLQEHIHELEYAKEMINFRLQEAKDPPSGSDEDTPFYWRYALQGRYISGDEEEYVEQLWRKGETEKAEALFRLLVECFDDYAEGHNYLGLMALEREELEEALEHFSNTILAGEKLFPKRLGKKHYWRDVKTRPYMRGVYNTIVTLIRIGDFDEALDFARSLEERCGDRITAEHYRARVFLNMSAWLAAFNCAGGSHEMSTGEGFIVALAAYELGREDDAKAYFLHAALQYPRAARMVAGYQAKKPKTHDEIRDHNVGAELHNNLRWHFRNRRRACETFFKKILKDPLVKELLAEVEELVGARHDGDAGDRRSTAVALDLLRSWKYAKAKAVEIVV